MKIITRNDAKTAGLTRYFSNLACPHGHISERRVSDCSCIECDRLKSASPQERERRREYMRVHQRRYRKRRPELVRATEQKRDKAKRAADRRAERAKDPERHRAILSKSFQKHKAKRMAETKAWKGKNKDAWRRHMRPIKVMRRAAEGHFDSSDVARMLIEQGGICAGCPSDISSSYHVDHIKPLSRGGTHWPDNLQLLCGPCNRSKGAKTMEEWIAWKAELTASDPPHPSPSCR